MPVFTLGGLPCAIIDVSDTAVDLQLPFDSPLGTSNLVVSRDGLTSAPFAISLNAYAPAFATYGGWNFPFYDTKYSSGSPVTPTSAAVVGDPIAALVVGLGATSPLVPAGQLPSSVALTLVQPVIRVGGQIAAVSFSGLRGDSVGLYEVDFTIPPGLSGTQEVTLEIGGIISPPVPITLAAPTTIAINPGSSRQMAYVGTAFAVPLSVTVKDAIGEPVPGIPVTFAAPGSGASATFSYGLNTAVTDASGVAAVSSFANEIAGSYDITASVPNLAQVTTFTVTNTIPTSTPDTLSVRAYPPGLGVASPPSGSAYPHGSVVQVIASPGPSSTFTGWSGPVAYPQSPSTAITMSGSESVTANFIGQQFTDVSPGTYYYNAVNLMSLEHITNGCGANTYCPTDLVTRAQAAVFIVRAVMHTDNFMYTTTPYFVDVPPGSFGFQWIQKMRDLGITTGCGPASFCPNDSVTRAQMAVFIMRARYGAATTFDFPSAPYFSDVSSTAFAFSYIQRMAQDHITNGCAPVSYCPHEPVTRGDMAIFVMRGAFNFLLPLTDPVIVQISPSAALPGQTITLNVSGVNTHFNQATTTVQPIPGFTEGTVTVTSPTSLTVALTAGSDTSLQPESIRITTGLEDAVIPNALSIQ